MLFRSIINAELARVSREENQPPVQQPNLFDLEEPAEPEKTEEEPQILKSEFPPEDSTQESEADTTQSELPENPDAIKPEPQKTTEAEEPEAREVKEPETEEENEPIFEIEQDQTAGEDRTIFLLDEDEDEASSASAVEEQSEEMMASDDEVDQPVKKEDTIRYSLEDYHELESKLRSAKPESSKTEKSTEVSEKEAATPEEKDEALQFEVRRVENRTGGESDGQPSPMEHSIEESMRMRVEERRAKFKAFNYHFKNHPYSVDEVSNEPAYKRQGVKIEETKYSEDSRAGRFTIEDGDGGSDIKTNNSFLHDNVD